MRTLLSVWLHVRLLACVRLLLLATDVLASIRLFNDEGWSAKLFVAIAVPRLSKKEHLYGFYVEPSTDINQENWEKDIRSAASLDELLMLTDFPDWKLWRCRLKLKHVGSASFPEIRSASVGSHRFTRFAANSYSLEVLKAIDEEWQKTQCMPRETCVDVAQELGTSSDMFFKPPCVSVFRCSGCCNKEGVTCRNTSTTYVDKILLSVVPFKYGPEPMLIRVANHTECKCQEPQMIRRHALPHRKSGCFPIRQSEDSRRLCDRGLIWDCLEDRCVPYPSSKQDLPSSTKAEDCEIDVEKCECVPKEVTSTRKNQSCPCGARRRQLNHTSCSCKRT